MSEITDIASTVSQISQSQLQEQVNVRVLKMALQAQKDMAKMLLENVSEVPESPNSTAGHIDIYV
jgi:uncharacterized protein YutE (UPF0331/DUF86 family)